MSLGILASSSLSFRFEQATPANIAGVVYKEVFERSERTFYRRKQRYSLDVAFGRPCPPDRHNIGPKVAHSGLVNEY